MCFKIRVVLAPLQAKGKLLERKRLMIHNKVGITDEAIPTMI